MEESASGAGAGTPAARAARRGRTVASDSRGNRGRQFVIPERVAALFSSRNQWLDAPRLIQGAVQAVGLIPFEQIAVVQHAIDSLRFGRQQQVQDSPRRVVG